VNHLQQYLVDEFVEDFQEGHLSRREALKRIAGITGMAAALQLLAACGQPATSTAPTEAVPAQPTTAPEAPTAMAEPTAAPTSAAEATAAPTAAPAAPQAGASPDSVAEDDPAIMVERVEFPSGDATMMGYLARPAGEGSFPIVLVCHENRGLTSHIEDVARRVAKAGYVGLAVDLLSREGGTANISDPASVPGLLSGAPPERHVQDFSSGLEYVKGQQYAQADRAGMVGFCFGGGVTWLVAAGVPELRAAVPFYGPPPPDDQLPNVSAAVLAVYAGNDQRINASIEKVEAAMQQNGKIYKKVVYEGVDHAFHNDTGQRYNQEAAQAAWGETMAWFQQSLTS
jgi:carboxymethylenebutenolidase